MFILKMGFLIEIAFALCLFSTPIESFPKIWRPYVAKEMLDKYDGKGLTGYSERYFQGDIDGIDKGLSSEDLHGQLNNAINDQKKRWPNGIVPYLLSEMYTEDDRRVEKTLIEVAMNTISSSTGYCITFVPRTKEEDYIYITRGLGCSSGVGRSGGRQVVSFTRGCLEEVGAIQHEFLHALGFYHENSRADRDDYVWINWKNLQPGAAKDFRIPSDAMTFGLPYDFDSILHYRHNAFAINNSAPTILPKQKARRIGQSAGLSMLDVLKLKRAYNCAEEEYEKAIGPTITTRKKTTVGTRIPPPLPKWKQGNLSIAECESLETKNCRHSGYISSPCEEGHSYFECNSSSTGIEIQFHLEQVKQALPFTPFRLELMGIKGLRLEFLDTFSDNLARLLISYVANFSSNTFAQLQLPNLLDLQFWGCTNIHINADTLKFSNLRLLKISGSTIAEIEEGSFESLISLKTIVFDYLLDGSISSERDHLWRLHCSSEYRWLRAYLKQHPELIQPRKKGEIYSVTGITSVELERSDIYHPVDCSRVNLTGDPNQIGFSLNAQD